jgi:RNA polymerase sigma-70 factor (ECF subfamily)
MCREVLVEDTWLLLKFRLGSAEALRRIYEKYENQMLTLGISFLNDLGAAEDVVHDVFVRFAEQGARIRLKGSLKAYLATSVANGARDVIRRRKVRGRHSGNKDVSRGDCGGPLETAIADEMLGRLGCAMAELSDEQREVIALRLQGGMTFRVIAANLGISVNTAMSRYRYGIDRLRSLLNSEVAE